METKLKIHPAIGIARVGNSAPESGPPVLGEHFYIGPNEAGGLPLNADGSTTEEFRNLETQALKRQAAQFQIYVYDEQNPEGRAIQLNDVVETKNGRQEVINIEWRVHLANKKACWYQFESLKGSGPHGYEGDHKLRNPKVTDAQARQKLIIDPGPLTVCGPNQHAEFSKGKAQQGYPQNFPPVDIKPFPIESLGELMTLPNGNLLVLGGKGNSGTSELPPRIDSYANNEGWYDDVSDGPVSANVLLADGSTIEVVPAWAIVAPPAFAPQILNQVTLYDAIYDVFVRSFGLNPELYFNGQFNPKYEFDFKSEILPIVSRASQYQWVTNMPKLGQQSHEAFESNPFGRLSFPMSRLRNPDVQEDYSNIYLMPQLTGDDPFGETPPEKLLAVTRTQYHLLKFWSEADSGLPPKAPDLGPGERLDQAVLENCVGGAFCPGIEMTWICRNTTLYEPLPAEFRASDAFRIRHKKVDGPLSTTYGSDGNYSAGLEPGDISKYMAQPWQSDFNECSDQGTGLNGSPLWWWPAQRPYDVHVGDHGEIASWTRGMKKNVDGGHEGDLEMVSAWSKLGFVVSQPGDVYLEVQRTFESDTNG